MRLEYANQRRIRERNKLGYRFAHWPIWIAVFYLLPGPVTVRMFSHGIDMWMLAWLGVVLAGTGIAGLYGNLPGVEPRPYIIRFTEDKPNPLYRRICYTAAWSELITYGVLNLVGLLIACMTGHWTMQAIYDTGYLPLAGAIWFLGLLGLLPRVKGFDQRRRSRTALFLRVRMGAAGGSRSVVADVADSPGECADQLAQTRGFPEHSVSVWHFSRSRHSPAYPPDCARRTRGVGLKIQYSPPGQMVRVGESILHMHVSGSGRPPIILEAGIAATSLSWALVESALAGLSTVVSYDRAGLGWSGPARTPRRPGIIASELREGLVKLGLGPPYLLVGHSFGGIVVQRFAGLFPEEVQGLVLADPLHPSEFCPLTPRKERMIARGAALSRRGAMLARAGVVGFSLRVLLAGNRWIPQVAARLTSGRGGAGVTDRLAGEIRKLPRELWPVIAWHWSQAKNFSGMAMHLESLPSSCAEMAENSIDASIPVTVLLAEQATRAELSRSLGSHYSHR